MPLRLSMLVLLVLSCAIAAASRARTEDFNPRAFVSQDGRWRLHMVPGHRNAAGPAVYTMSLDGAEQWKREIPFTFWSAELTNDGIAAGYAYSAGEDAWRSYSETPGDIIAAAINPQGVVTNEARLERKQLPFLDTPPTWIIDYRVDWPNQRMVLQVVDENLNRRADKFWVVPLAAGGEARLLNPLETMIDQGETAGLFSIAAFSTIHGTSLIAVAARRKAAPFFLVMDGDGGIMWEREGTAVGGGVRLSIRDGGAQNPGVALFMVGEEPARCVKVVQAAGKWEVQELAEFLTIPPPTPRPEPQMVAPSTAVDLAAVPVVELEQTAAYELSIQNKNASGSFGQLPRDFAVDADGHFVFVRDRRLVRMTPEGREIGSVTFGSSNAQRHYVLAETVVRHRYAVATETTINGERASVPAIVDFETSSVLRLDRRLYGIFRLAGSRSGHFAHLGWANPNINYGKMLVIHDADGTPTWERPISNGSNDKYSTVDSIAFLGSDRLGLLCRYPDRVEVVGLDGTDLGSMPLPKLDGERMYVHALGSAPNGGFTFANSMGIPNGQVRFHVMSATGELVSSWLQPRRGLVWDGAQHFWFSDGYTFRRINLQGEIDGTVGAEQDAEEIGDLAGMVADDAGRLILVSRRTGVAHFFDEKGKVRGRVRLDPADYQFDTANSGAPRMSATAEGALCIGRAESDRVVVSEYRPDGTRTERYHTGISRPIGGDVYTAADGKGARMVAYKEVVFFPGDDQTPMVVTHDAAGRWIEHTQSFPPASDGSLVYTSYFNMDAARVFSFLDSNGSDAGMVVVPHHEERYRMRASAAQGRLILAQENRLYVLHPAGTGDFAMQLPDGALWRPFAVAGGAEVLLFDGVSAVRRYRLPTR